MRSAPFSLLVVCLLASTVLGQTIRVPQDHPTIQAAINAAPNGASILVAPGTYTEDLTVNNKVLTIQGEGGAGVTSLRASAARALILSNGASVTLRSFTVRPASAGGASGISSTGSTLAVRDCIFENCRAPGNSDGGAARVSGGVATFARCRFIGNIAINFGGAISVGNSGTITVHNCTFEQNTSGVAGGAIDLQPGTAVVANSLFVGNSSPNGGGFATISTGSQIVNCTFANNTITTGVGQAVAYGGSGTNLITIANSIFWGNSGGAGAGAAPIAATTGPSSTFAVTYSNVQGGYAGVGNINTDPLFRSAASGDFRLGSGSPCIDAGNNAAAPPDILDLDGDGNVSEPIPFDLDGEDRFVDDPGAPDTGVGPGPIVDMGPYERPGPCPADFNGDGQVNSGDITAFLSAWLQAVQQGCP